MHIQQIIRWSLIVGLTGALGWGVAAKARPGDGAQGFMDRLDADLDGTVNAEEFDGPADHFEQLDVDGDGLVTDDELPDPPPVRRR
jgi:hypothetical protein